VHDLLLQLSPLAGLSACSCRYSARHPRFEVLEPADAPLLACAPQESSATAQAVENKLSDEAGSAQRLRAALQQHTQDGAAELAKLKQVGAGCGG
jgi:hypothetical protein